MSVDANIAAAQEKFAELIRSEYERIERMKADNEVTASSSENAAQDSE